jgi:hypothetical protein
MTLQERSVPFGHSQIHITGHTSPFWDLKVKEPSDQWGEGSSQDRAMNRWSSEVIVILTTSHES